MRGVTRGGRGNEGEGEEKRKIGQGGFGAVYKAKLLDGTVVAVKRAKKVF